MSNEQGVPSWGGAMEPSRPDGAGADYGAMIDQLRLFLDRVAAAGPDAATTNALADDLRGWAERLEPLAVPERDQPWAHQRHLPGRGQTMAPRLVVEGGDTQSVFGHVTFGRFFLGGNGAVHGGAIPLVFDEILGRLANTGDRRPSRTAYLNVDFRSITPVGARLSIHGWYVSETGRKRLLRGELRHGDTLCAEAEGLFVELKPGQP